MEIDCERHLYRYSSEPYFEHFIVERIYVVENSKVSILHVYSVWFSAHYFQFIGLDLLPNLDVTIEGLIVAPLVHNGKIPKSVYPEDVFGVRLEKLE